MARYYFDHRDGNTFISDDEGLEFDGIEAVRDEATRALAGIAKDALPGSVRREITIEVRDEASRPVLRAALWFEVQTLV
jgi:hypothetical protein